MKIRRYKKVYKSLNFYVNNFGFFKPFQILIDGTFCFAALQNGVQIKEDVPKYLGSDLKLLTTPCVIIETEKLGAQVSGAMKIVKTFGVHKCGHKKPLTGSNCFLSMVRSNNSNRYVIATQDKDLQNKLQNVPAVPILYFNRTSIVLKNPSESSISLANKQKEATLGLSEYQEKILNTLKKKTLGDIEKPQDDKIVPKKPRGPNPLSCKRKKTSIETIQHEPISAGKKHQRKRKRIRIPAHVKHVKQEVLTSLTN